LAPINILFHVYLQGLISVGEKLPRASSHDIPLKHIRKQELSCFQEEEIAKTAQHLQLLNAEVKNQLRRQVVAEASVLQQPTVPTDRIFAHQSR
jgi:hypothetical protein